VNAENRVAKGTITSMSYDPTENGFQLTESYVLGAGGEELTMRDGHNNWQRTNVSGATGLLATYDTNGLHFHLKDPLGSRRMQINGNLVTMGVPESDIQSFPYGDQLYSYPDVNAPPTGDDATPLYFTGKERDAESGNDYFGARYYASTMGRFLSPDPSQLAYADPSNPQSLNLYNYGLNNPLINIDPTGLDCVTDTGNNTVSYNTGDCENGSQGGDANKEYYIDCDGCTSGATGAHLDQATGDLYLTTTTTDSLGNSVETPLAGTTVQGFASPDPTALTTNVQVSGGAAGSVTMSGYGIGLLAYFPYANLSLPPATIRDPNAPPALPKLKGKDKRLCLWGQMTNEMLGGEGGPSDSTDTAPGRGGAAAIRSIRPPEEANRLLDKWESASQETQQWVACRLFGIMDGRLQPVWRTEPEADNVGKI
jgi:RHS repeat-associated protein